MSKEEYWRLETETRESSKISWHKCSWTLEEPPKKIDVTSKPPKFLLPFCTDGKIKPKKNVFGTV